VPRLLASTVALAALAAAAGCGQGEDDSGAQRSAPAPTVATRAHAAGRTVVATVNGEPIYGDCVATQAGAAGIDVDAALARCIDFEVLAQEAARRGLLGDSDVLDARRTEMVRALVEQEYAPTLDDPSDVPITDLHWLWESQLQRRYNRPELRRATYCRAPVAKDAPAGGPEDQRARKLAEGMYAALSAMGRLDAAHLAPLCWMVSGGQEVKTTASPTRPFTHDGQQEAGRYAPEFAEAAFSVAAVGDMSRPARTSWGWDLVLVTDILPAQSRTFEQAEPEMRDILIHRADTAPYRNRMFEAWIKRYMDAARVQVFPDNVPDDQALAQGAAPPAAETR
jgi:hypothetical protein